MPRYIRITRSDVEGNYTVLPEEAPGMIQAELDCVEWDEPGTRITLTVVEMPRDEFANLPEFEGW